MSSRLRLQAFAQAAEGATAVEFAVIAIPLLLMVMGCVEFGRMIWMRQSISEVAVMTARCAGLPQSECADSGARNAGMTQSYAIGLASKWGLSLAASNVTLDVAATCGGAPGFSKVTVTYTFVSVVPKLIKAVVSNPMTASACFPNSATN